METECRKWNAISVGECTSRSVEWKGVQSHVESAGRSQNECPLTIVLYYIFIIASGKH